MRGKFHLNFSILIHIKKVRWMKQTFGKGYIYVKIVIIIIIIIIIPRLRSSTK